MDKLDNAMASCSVESVLQSERNTNMEEFTDESDETILARLVQLGETKEKDKVMQLFVKCDEDSVIQLAEIWNSFRDLLESNKIKNVHNIFESLIRYTAWIILDVRFSNKIEVSVKSKLSQSIQNIISAINDSLPSIKQVCSSLIPLTEKPWTNTTFTDAIVDANLMKKTATGDLWSAEGWLILEIRMESMGRYKKLPTIHVIYRMLSICLYEGERLYWPNFLTTEWDENLFDPFRYTLEQYFDLLEAYILMWNWDIKLVDIKYLKNFPLSITCTVIKRLCSKAISLKPGRLLPRLWHKADLNRICFRFIQTILPDILKQENKSEDVETLLEMWLDMNLETAPEDNKSSKATEVVNDILFYKESIHSTGYLYSLANIILRKLGKESVKETYIGIYSRAITVDINSIEALRAETPLNPEKIRIQSESLSSRELEMAAFFCDFKNTSWEITLTAFSLNPSQELFDQLFPENGDSKPKAEDLRLPLELGMDLDMAINRPRWSALGRYTKGEELKNNCMKMLKEDMKWLKTGIQSDQLMFLNNQENFDKYRDLPSRYDPNDTGIETGFSVSGKRRSNKSRKIPGMTRKYTRHTTLNHNTVNHKGPKRNLVGSLGRGKWIRTNKMIKNGLVTKKNPVVNSKKQPTKRTLDSIKKKTPETPKVDGRCKDLDLQGKLQQITQYIRQNETLREFLNKADKNQKLSNLSRMKRLKLKEYYKLSYLREEKRLPGDFQLIHVPRAYKINSRGSHVDTNRRKPTGYVCPPVPYQLKIQGIGDFDIEFRFERQQINSKVINNLEENKIRSNQMKRLEHYFPKTDDDQWRRTEEDFGINLSSPRKLIELRARAMKTGTKVKVNKDKSIESSELKNLVKQYNELKENEYSMNPPNLKSGGAGSKVFEVLVGFGPQIKENEEFSDSSQKPNSIKQFSLGEIWEHNISKKHYKLPPGPTSAKESKKLELMLEEAEKRLQMNLKHKTYEYETVQRELKTLKELMATEELPGTRIIGPLTEEEQHFANLKATAQKKRVVFASNGSLNISSFSIPLQKCDVNGDISVAINGTHPSRGRKRKCDKSMVESERFPSTSSILLPKSPQKFEKTYVNGKSGLRNDQNSESDASGYLTLEETFKSPNKKSPKKCKRLNPEEHKKLEEILQSVPDDIFDEFLAHAPEFEPPGGYGKGKKLGNEVTAMVWKLYNSGLTSKKIQEKLNISWSSVSRLINNTSYLERLISALKSNSSLWKNTVSDKMEQEFRRSFGTVSRRHRVRYKSDYLGGNLDEAISCYLDGMPASKVALKYGIPLHTLNTYLHLLENGGQSKNFLNTEEFSEDDESISNSYTSAEEGIETNHKPAQEKQSEEIFIIEPEPEKPKITILFPMLQLAGVRKAGELVAGKPLDFPKLPEKKILDDQTGEMVAAPSGYKSDDEDSPEMKSVKAIPWEEESNGFASENEHSKVIYGKEWQKHVIEYDKENNENIEIISSSENESPEPAMKVQQAKKHFDSKLTCSARVSLDPLSHNSSLKEASVSQIKKQVAKRKIPAKKESCSKSDSDQETHMLKMEKLKLNLKKTNNASVNLTRLDFNTLTPTQKNQLEISKRINRDLSDKRNEVVSFNVILSNDIMQIENSKSSKRKRPSTKFTKDPLAQLSCSEDEDDEQLQQIDEIVLSSDPESNDGPVVPTKRFKIMNRSGNDEESNGSIVNGHRESVDSNVSECSERTVLVPYRRNTLQDSIEEEDDDEDFYQIEAEMNRINNSPEMILGDLEDSSDAVYSPHTQVFDVASFIAPTICNNFDVRSLIVIQRDEEITQFQQHSRIENVSNISEQETNMSQLPVLHPSSIIAPTICNGFNDVHSMIATQRDEESTQSTQFQQHASNNSEQEVLHPASIIAPTTCNSFDDVHSLIANQRDEESTHSTQFQQHVSNNSEQEVLHHASLIAPTICNGFDDVHSMIATQRDEESTQSTQFQQHASNNSEQEVLHPASIIAPTICNSFDDVHSMIATQRDEESTHSTQFQQHVSNNSEQEVVHPASLIEPTICNGFDNVHSRIATQRDEESTHSTQFQQHVSNNSEQEVVHPASLIEPTICNGFDDVHSRIATQRDEESTHSTQFLQHVSNNSEQEVVHPASLIEPTICNGFDNVHSMIVTQRDEESTQSTQFQQHVSNNSEQEVLHPSSFIEPTICNGFELIATQRDEESTQSTLFQQHSRIENVSEQETNMSQLPVLHPSSFIEPTICNGFELIATQRDEESTHNTRFQQHSRIENVSNISEQETNMLQLPVLHRADEDLDLSPPSSPPKLDPYY